MEQNNINGDQVKSVDGTLQSVYFSSSEIIKQQLDNVSPSFCLAKWFNVSIHIPNGQTHSCYHPRSHHIPLEEVKIDVSALHNTKYKKEQLGPASEVRNHLYNSSNVSFRVRLYLLFKLLVGTNFSTQFVF